MCSCGSSCIILGVKLRNGWTKSCRCLSLHLLMERSATHRLTAHPLYSVWAGMKDRVLIQNVLGFLIGVAGVS